MKKLIIKHGLLISPLNGYHQTKKDILIEDGRITAIEDSLCMDGVETIDAEGCLVTPGLIDSHVHCFPHASLSLDPDVLGVERGATTIIDAGSSGPQTYELFRTNYINTSKTKVFTLLNISKRGLEEKHELNDWSKIDEEAVRQMVKTYPDNIVGLKARASASVVGELGLAPIQTAATLAHELKLPLMVHVGNYPPALGDVLNLLQENDIVTHAYHGKKGGILDSNQKIISEAMEARKRGVLFDVGHGEASFSFGVYQQALQENFDCDCISTDLHIGNYNGPVYHMAAVLTKVINCGEPLEEAIAKATNIPAQIFKLKDLGELRVGAIGDISIMRLIDTDEIVVDSMKDELVLKQKLTLQYTVCSKGEQSELFRHDTIE